MYTLSKKRAKAKFQTLGDTPWDVETKALAPFVAVTIRVNSETRGHELGDVAAKALVLMLLDMRKDLDTKTRPDKLEDVEAKPIFDNLADTIAEAYSETLFPNNTHCAG